MFFLIMAAKQKVGEIAQIDEPKTETFYLTTELESSGLTYDEIMSKYGITRWGSRKIGDHPDTTSERGEDYEKIIKAENMTDSLVNMAVPMQDPEPNHEEQQRQDLQTKQSATKKAGTYLKQLEEQVKNTETPDTEYSEPDYSDKGVTAIIHETDSHFSAHVKNRHGEVVYNTETAWKATNLAFSWYVDQIFQKVGAENLGGTINGSKVDDFLDEVVLLLGGDILEGEGIYETQSYKIDDTLENQITAARKCYFENIRHLKESLGVPIKVVCVSGNHGDLKIPGSSSGANADDIIYSSLEDMIDLSDLEDIKFVKSNRSDYTLFNYRGWKGYLTHGENRSNHIGTSSPQSDWLAIKDKFGFDAAWRGHYHNQKRENVNGAPVFMTNSRKPGDDYTDKIATFGATGNAIYFATDDEPVADVRTQSDVL